MSRQESPYARGFEAGFKAGWAAREKKAVEAMAEMVLLVKPTDIEAAQARIEKRAQRPANDPRPDFPGKAVMDARGAHMREGHPEAFKVCEAGSCYEWGAHARAAADEYAEWVIRQ